MGGLLETILLLLLMLLLLFLLLLIACKPWRFLFSSPSSSRPLSIKSDELERPLVSDNADVHEQSNEVDRNYDLEGACYNEGFARQGLVHKQRVAAASPNMGLGDSLVLDVVSEPEDDISLGQTLRCPLLAERLAEVQKHVKKEDQTPNFNSSSESEVFGEIVPKFIADQRSCLSLEVISGLSRGLHCSVQSTDTAKLPITLGRVSTNLQFKDSEVSGKHALINWNADKKKWELIDMGSLNGTLLNSQSINHPDSGKRRWGDPMELSDGDIITLGTTSKVNVHVTSKSVSHVPFGLGMASDPMALRRGARKLPMEDVCYFQWPLPGVDQFGIFGICDGHGGVAAANSASKLLPEKVASILSDSLTRESVLSQCDASDVLRVAFAQTEASMNNYYEGCTATVLLVWLDKNEKLFVQCANVGDSACIMSVDEKQIKMTEDHRVVSYSERLRMSEVGEPLRDGETRLCGLNLARMLGDKFLKQQDLRFSSDPFISQAVHIDEASSAFAVLASDGFWDVIGVKKAIQLVVQAREKYSAEGGENTAERVAAYLLNEAKTLRTKDNTTIIYLDFDRKSRIPCKVDS